MRKTIIAVSVFLVAVGIFGGGVYSGLFIYNYDVLCEKTHSAHKLKNKFISEDGIVLPKDTVVYLRGCKPNTQARLEFHIDDWNYQHTEKLKTNQAPTYYLDIGSDESGKT